MHEQVIELPEVELFPGCRAKFHLAKDQVPFLPPDFFFTTVFIEKEARKTFAALLTGLQSQLGVGEDVSVSNTLSRHWTDGLLNLKLTAWPPETNTWGSNAISEKDPNYAFESHVSIENGGATRLITETELRAFDQSSKKIDLGNVSLQFMDSFPSHLTRLWFWRNPSPQSPRFFTGDRVGYFGPKFSLVLEKSKVTTLELIRLLPARGGGASYITARYGDQNPTLLSGRRTHDCDELAKTLSKFWGLPLEIKEYPDD